MHTHVTHRPAAELRADLLAVPLGLLDPKRRAPAGAARGPRRRALAAASPSWCARGDFRGKRGESQLLWVGAGAPAPRVLLIGLGDEAQLESQGAREAAAAAVSAAAGRGAKAGGAARAQHAPAAPARAGAGAGRGRRARPATASTAQDRERGRPEEGRVLRRRHRARRRPARRRARPPRPARIVADSQNLARDLSNEPPNLLPPRALARAAERIAKEVGLRCRILDVAELRRRKMGALLAVAGGSANPPRLIVLEHGAPAARGARRAPPRAGVPRRQGRHLRLGRPLAQADRQHGDDEARHVGRRGGDRRAARLRAAEAPASTWSASSARSRTCRAAPPTGPTTS